MLAFCVVPSGVRRRQIACSAATGRDANQGILDRVLPTVVKVHCASCSPNMHLPWLSKPVEERVGTGFLVGAKEILTSAHVLKHWATISVELPAQSKHNSRRMFPAHVVSVAEECDLALVSVEDDHFWQHVSIRLGLQVSKKIPRPGEEVNVVRAASGGIERGGYVSGALVNAIDIRAYLYGGSSMLTLEIVGSRFTPGVSGAPVVRGAQVVGMIHQRNDEEGSVAHAVPGVIIQKFLDDYETEGEFKGMFTLPLTYQKMENESLRRSMGMNALETGILITGFNFECEAMKKIAVGDVLLEIDRIRIANDGTISLRDENERVNFDYLAAFHPPDVDLNVRILRDGGEMDVTVRTSRHQRTLPLSSIVDRTPKYFIFGGLVFTPLSYPYLEEWGQDWITKAPENLIRAERQRVHNLDSRKKEVVVCSAVLPDKVNLGYDSIEHRVVESVSGVPVHDLKHMHFLVHKEDNAFIQIDLQDGGLLVLGQDAVRESEARILKQYRIPSIANIS